jgi:hypothetical protein
MKKIVLVLLMVLLSVMLVVSCKEPEANIEWDDLTGTRVWWQQEFDNGRYFRIQFKDDKTTVILNEGTNGTYSANVTMSATLKDNVLTLTSTDPEGGATSATYTYKLSFDGDKLVLTQTSEDSMCSKYSDQKTFTMEKKNLG